MSSETNKWDSISIDAIITPLVSKEQQDTLIEEGFWGRYVLDTNGVCYRTRVVLGLLCMSASKWRKALSGGFAIEEKDQQKANGILLKALTPERDEIEGKIRQVEKLRDIKLESQRETLIRRWRQIQKLLDDEIRRVGN